jgi:hypothetical protein
MGRWVEEDDVLFMRLQARCLDSFSGNMAVEVAPLKPCFCYYSVFFCRPVDQSETSLGCASGSMPR